IPVGRSCQIIEDLSGHRVSQAMVIESSRLCVEKILPFQQAVKERLKSGDVVHFDESGLRVCNKLHQLHVAGTPEMTYYTVDQKRGAEAMEAMDILPGFTGTAVHDHWKPYFQYDHCKHELCNAHHLRELNFIHDRYGQDWAPQMSCLLVEIHHQVRQAKLQNQQHLDPAVLSVYESRYDAIIKAGLEINPPAQRRPGQRGRVKQPPARNLLERLRIFKDQTLGFMYDFKVPFDNNQAERDVRMIKVKQKVSGCFRTFEGAEIFCAIRSYISTSCKNGINVIDAIQNAFQGKPFIPYCFSTPE
ncbi:IS66 family transposase, partial [Desulfococcaceae bacterium HSG9]|nr:IS66 family transposase [Desulfococcaceae bacterium HSG9]